MTSLTFFFITVSPVSLSLQDFSFGFGFGFGFGFDGSILTNLNLDWLYSLSSVLKDTINLENVKAAALILVRSFNCNTDHVCIAMQIFILDFPMYLDLFSLLFPGPDGKNLLNEKDYEFKNELKQIPHKEVRWVRLEITRTSRRGIVSPGVRWSSILIEKDNLASPNIVAANAVSHQQRSVWGWLGRPAAPRTGICVDRILPAGNIQENYEVTWDQSGMRVKGVVCKALYLPGVIFTDMNNRPINYRGNEMIIPYSNY